MTATQVRRLLAGTAFLALLCAPAACRRAEGHSRVTSAAPEAPESPSFLLITLDTWRWDYIGASGSGKVATPALDRLAREGIYEPEAETPVPLTTPAHATILTGLAPLHHGVLDCISYALAPDPPVLAEAFAASGRRTAAFLSSVSLDRRYGLDRGFQTYDQGEMGRNPALAAFSSTRDGAQTTDAALAYLGGQPARTPLFVWIHYYDMHLPYRDRPAYTARYPKDAYAAQAAFLDDEVARVLAALQADRGRAWRVLIAGDHGEGFGDHHEMGHGMALYRSTLHVPLIFWPRPDRPLQHARPWSLEDLDSTVREWFGLPAAGAHDGESLFRPGGVDRLLTSMTIQPCVQFAVNACLGVRRGPLMYMRHGIEELFDLASDPGETRDLAADAGRRADVESLRRACNAAFPPAALQAALAPTANVSSADLQNLRSLGYLGGGARSDAKLQRADIRQVCDDEALLAGAKEAYRRDRNPEPLAQAYAAVLARYPRAALCWQEYGTFLLERNRTDEAARAFEQAVRYNPKDTTALVNLGGLELSKGRVDRAKVLYEMVLGVDPDDPVAHKNLGIIFAEYLKDPPQAVSHYKRYLEIAPDSDAGLVKAYIAAHAQ
jgi:choline-sulfatase